VSGEPGRGDDDLLRASLLRVMVLIAFAAGTLFGLLVGVLALPPTVVAPVLFGLYVLVWLVMPIRRRPPRG
jgi:hypothetical protein